MDVLTARRTLAQARLAVGIAALVAPRVTARFFGVDLATNPAAPYLTRMFGARELYMAAPFLMPAPGLDESELASRGVKLVRPPDVLWSSIDHIRSDLDQ